METRDSRKLTLYILTLLIELLTGWVRLIITFPLTLLLLGLGVWLLSRLGIEPSLSFLLTTDLQQLERTLVWTVLGISLALAYANIIASVIAYLGYGGGSLMTRFVLGARDPSSRERETILQIFEQMAAGAQAPLRSYSKLYVVDSVLEFANLVGTTLYISSAGLRGSNLQALVAHEFGHLNHGDGSLILALRRLVFPPFSLFIGGIRDFSTNRPAYRPSVREFDAVQIFYSLINNLIFFWFAFVGGGLGVWVMSWAWAGYFRARDYLADAFATGLGYRDLLVRYLEANIYFDTSVPYMLGWRPAAELRIDALLHPGLYGLPAYGDVPAAAEGVTLAALEEVEPATGEAPAVAAATASGAASGRARRYFTVALVVVFGYLLLRSWPDMQARVEALLAGIEAPPVPATTTPETEAEVETVPVTATPLAVELVDCLATVSTSRALRQNGSGENCWLKLADGAPATIDVQAEVQITYRTMAGGDVVYFAIAGPGDRLTNVVGATIRPMPFVEATYGGVEEVRAFETAYHSPGGGWVTCLWDADNDWALNDQCAVGNGTEGFVGSRSEMLVAYDAVYREQGWCSLWARLVADGLVGGECPASVLEFVYEDVSSAGGRANLLTGAQMTAGSDTEVYYQACATFDGSATYTGGSVEPWIDNDFIGTNTTMHAGSVFTLYFRCDNAWSPSVSAESTSDATAVGEAANGGSPDCRGTELGPLVQGDHYFEAPVIVLQLWRMNGDSPWGSGEVTTVVENEVTIRATGGNAWSYPAADCLNVATIEMQGGANLRGSTIVTPDELRAAGMIE